jgi:hypothetical protein
MPSIVIERPHCGAEKVGFDIVAEKERPSTAEANDDDYRIWDDLATCT